jgi:peroxiredoxin family protein
MPGAPAIPRPRERSLPEQSLVEFNRQRTECQRQLAEKYKLENQITRGEVLRKAELAKTFALIADAMVTRIMSATEIPRTVREDLLRDLSSWPLALEETRDAQTRLKKAAQEKTQGESAPPALS